MSDYRKIPVGPRSEGKDTGYRDYPFSEADARNPVPMVVVTGVKTHPPYSLGAVPKLTQYYGNGLGASLEVLVREPLLLLLLTANALFKPYGIELVVLDGWRPWWIQSALWCYLRETVIASEGLTGKTLSLYEEILVGMRADDIGSYCALLKDTAFFAEKKRLKGGNRRRELASAARRLGITTGQAAELYLTFQTNLGLGGLTIDRFATTAHGSGGAVDLYLKDLRTGEFVFLGVPFDYVAAKGIELSPAVMDYFEVSTIADFRRAIALDPTLAWYVNEFDYDDDVEQAFADAQMYRRILYHVMKSLGASFYSDECWHWQINNACDAVIKQLKEAPWGNEGAFLSVSRLYSDHIPSRYW